MNYNVIEFEDGKKAIHATDDLGNVYSIPFDEANSDYQAYLNPVEHLTEIPTPEQSGTL